ncbi:MAG: uL15 family ribosomal protein [Candidatus Azambacteria bacterium]|nr:uL15 family ribosomal protein [Candidatus Azambacteria bacterium]
MQFHQIQPKHKTKKKKRIARGGKRGGYSGRGSKGQKSRAGAKIRPAIRDLIEKFPKQRGRAKHAFKSLTSKPTILNLRDIDKKFSAKEIVNPQTLFEKGLISKKASLSKIKILGEGKISKKITFQNVLISESAKNKIMSLKTKE